MSEDRTELIKRWLAEGIEKGWCSQIVCDHHEGVPVTDEEATLEMEEFRECCVFVVRIWNE